MLCFCALLMWLENEQTHIALCPRASKIFHLTRSLDTFETDTEVKGIILGDLYDVKCICAMI